MKLLTNEKIYENVGFAPSADGCIIMASENIMAGDTLRIETDDGTELRTYTVADYLRCEVRGRQLVLSNTPVPAPTPINLAALKARKVAQSKAVLAGYLENHPLKWVDGKSYSVTAEKQALLNNALAVYQLAAAAGQAASLTWNATGEACTDWEFEALCGLALDIAAYVKPLVAKQQALEVAIRAAADEDAVNAVVIEYAAID